MSSTPSDPESDNENSASSTRCEILAASVDDISLLTAARRHRLPGDRPTEHELAFFPELWDSKAAVDVFLIVRNTTLATWLTNQWKECTPQDVCGHLNPPFNSDFALIEKIVNYLTRHGIINFGRFTRSTKIERCLLRNERKAIVIGAGAAGIAAASQLYSFGFDVIILEARDYIGGRAQSIVKDGHVLETGCDSIRNLDNSPIRTLIHQMEVEQSEAFENTNIFVDGKPVDPNRDRLIAGMYMNLKGALNYLAHRSEHRSENGMFISRQQAYENVFSMIERTTLINYYNYCKTSEEIAREREHHYKMMDQLRKVALMAEKRLTDMTDNSDPLLRRSLKRDIVTALKKFDEADEAFELCENHLANHKKNPCCKQYMHPKDFRNYNFLLGFEEFLIGAPLEKVQFSCDAEQNKHQGAITRLKDGVANLLERIVQRPAIDVRLNHRVRNIDYSTKDYVKLKIEKPSGEIQDVRASLVVSTFPIGVLKKTITEDPRAPTFNPPLPEKKVKAIRAMGSGLINKVIMVFERSFWESPERNQFCTVSPSVTTRSSMLVWSSVPGSKVLTTYIIGDSSVHDIPDDVLIANAMAILQKTFPQNCPKQPLFAHCTHWQNDELAFGSGSFMSLRTETHHFDDLIEPLAGPDSKKRVYFAGEHTSAEHTASLEGAWRSGIRVAADIATDHIGVGYIDLSSDEPSTSTAGRSKF